MWHSAMARPEGMYVAVMEEIFFNHYKKGELEFEFDRTEIVDAAARLGLRLPKNVGDVIYSMRYRQTLSDRIVATQPTGKEWSIMGRGKARYVFRLGPPNRIQPGVGLLAIKLPDSTPEIVTKYSVADEQALLSRVRYNRLIDVFLGIVAYSLQNHRGVHAVPRRRQDRGF